MQLLLESRERQGLGWGIALSVVIHAALLGFVLFAYRGEPERRSLVEEIVTFLAPPDRPQGRMAAGPVAWDGLADKGAGAGTGQGRPVRGEGPAARLPKDSAGPAPAMAEPLVLGDSILTELEVDSTVRRYDESAIPEYPPALLARNLEGSALVTFVVDTTGLADTLTFTVLLASHPDFADAVRQALPRMRFRPAMLMSVKVRQLVQQSFGFRITRPDSIPPRRPPPPDLPRPAPSGVARATH
jgi:protein TonB